MMFALFSCPFPALYCLDVSPKAIMWYSFARFNGAVGCLEQSLKAWGICADESFEVIVILGCDQCGDSAAIRRHGDRTCFARVQLSIYLRFDLSYRSIVH